MPLPIIAPMALADLDEIMALERLCFPTEPWTRRMYAADLKDDSDATFLVLRAPAPLSPSGHADAGSPWQAASIPAGANPEKIGPGQPGIETLADFSDPQAQPVTVSNPENGLNIQRQAVPVVAWGGLWLLADEAHIGTLATHPGWRGCGLAQWLMLALLDVAQARGARLSTLEVRADNAPAQGLYRKLGYEIVGLRKHYYRDGTDGLIMTTPPLADGALQARLAAVRRDAVARLETCFNKCSDNPPESRPRPVTLAG